MTDDRRPPGTDPALDAAWRAYSVETPPPALDAAILAAARREAKSRPRAAGDDDTLAEAREPARWWWGLAAAATIGAVAFGLVQLAPGPELPDTMAASDVPATVREAPASPALKASPATTAWPESGERTAPLTISPPSRTDLSAQEKPAESKRLPSSGAAKLAAGPPPVQQDVGAGAPATREAVTAPPATPATVAPSAPAATPSSAASGIAPSPQPFPAAAPAIAQAPAAMAKVEADAVVPPAIEVPRPRADPAARIALPAAERSSVAADAARPPAVASVAVAPPAPADFVARIERLLANGRVEDAARELEAFRVAYPDADERLPAALKPWAVTIPRKR